MNSPAATFASTLLVRRETDLLELLAQSLTFRPGFGLLIRQVRPPAFLLRLGAFAISKLVAILCCPSGIELLLVVLALRVSGRRAATTPF